jgi:hypothetical protein
MSSSAFAVFPLCLLVALVTTVSPAPAQPGPAAPQAPVTDGAPAPQAAAGAAIGSTADSAAAVTAAPGQVAVETPAQVSATATNAGNAGAGPSFMDMRLSFTCTHEDILRDPRVLPSAPGFHCGRPNGLGILFFDNYDTRFSGFETLSHLALYRHYQRGHWEMEGGFLVRVNELAEDNIRMSDGGSFIRVAYWFDRTHANQNRLALVTFPVSSDRMRLGYSYLLSWGGSPEFFKANPDAPQSSGKNPESVPGLKLELDTDRYYVYGGIKSSLLLDPEINEQRSVTSFLGGAGMDLSPMVRVEVNGGVFDRGKNEAPDVLGERVWLYGLSGQLSIHRGMPMGSSIDYKLYRNTPENIARLFRREEYPGGLTWLVATEATMLNQTLKDPERTGSTTTQMAYAGDVNVRVKIDYTRLKFDLMVRDLAYILHSVPSLPTYWDFPATYDSTPELFAAAGGDYYFPQLGLTLGATAGVDLPATLSTPTAAAIPGNMTSSTTLVVRNQGDRTVLPAGEDVAITWALKGSGRVDFGESFATVADIYYRYDPNTVRYDRASAEDTFSSVQFANFDQLGFNLTLQARF